MKKHNNPKNKDRMLRKNPTDSIEALKITEDVKDLMMSTLGDLMLDGPFDLKERASASSLRKTRLLLRKAAEGDLSPWQYHVRQAGADLVINLMEYELCILVWHCSVKNKEAWRSMVPLTQSDNPLCAALGIRALIKTHPGGIEEGAKEALFAIRRRFDYLNLADTSPEEHKIRSAAWMLRAMLLLGAEELLPWAKDLGTLLPADAVKASILEPLSEDDEPSYPANTLTVLFCINRLSSITEDHEDYEFFVTFLLSMPILNRDYTCLERYRYPRGKVAPTIEFISYPDWLRTNVKLMDDLAYREVGTPEDSFVSAIKESWSSTKHTKPSKKQVARQCLLSFANKCGIRLTKDFPFKW